MIESTQRKWRQKMNAIFIKNLTKVYNDQKIALNEFVLSVKQGEIFSLLGSNGAGKTTLINILTTFLNPTSGTIQILGKDLKNNKQFIRSKIACVAQHLSIDDTLTVAENMKFQGGLYGLDKTTTKERLHYLAKCFNLFDSINRKAKILSGGTKRRLDIAMNMMSYPKILFLDEPTVGLDLQSRQDIWEILKKVNQELGITIFMTTHYLEEADMLSDSIGFIKDGKNIIQDTPTNLKQFTRKNIIKITIAHGHDAETLKSLLLEKDYITYVSIEDRWLFIQVDHSQKHFAALNGYLMSTNIEIEGIEITQPTLETIFLEMIGERSS